MYVPGAGRSKFDARGESYILVGFLEDLKAYKLINPHTHQPRYARSVLVNEAAIFQPDSGSDSRALTLILYNCHIQGRIVRIILKSQFIILKPLPHIILIHKLNLKLKLLHSQNMVLNRIWLVRATSWNINPTLMTLLDRTPLCLILLKTWMKLNQR